MGAAVMDIWSCVECIICNDIRIVRCGVYACVYRIITTAVYRGTAVYYQHHRKPGVYADTVRIAELAIGITGYSDCTRDDYLGDDCHISPHAVGCVYADSVSVMGFIRYGTPINDYCDELVGSL